MSVKTIAAVVSNPTEAEWLLPAVVDLARTNDAHLMVVHPAEPLGPYASDYVYQSSIVADLMERQAKETQMLRATFDGLVAREGVSAEFRGQETLDIGADTFLLEGVRAADVVVTGQIDHGDRAAGRGRLQELLIRHSGRPVLMLPRQKHLPKAADRLLIGWSPTREATRAAHEALRLAAPGASIDLLTVHSDRSSSRLVLDSRQDLAAAFDRLGFRTELLDRDAARGESGHTLLQTAFERGAELIATGAFGHSRTYDFVIGAVTSHLLAHSEIPVLLSK